MTAINSIILELLAERGLSWATLPEDSRQHIQGLQDMFVENVHNYIVHELEQKPRVIFGIPPELEAAARTLVWGEDSPT